MLKWHREQQGRAARSGTQRRSRTLKVLSTALGVVQSLTYKVALPENVWRAVRAISPTEYTPAQIMEAVRLVGPAVSGLLEKSLQAANALSKVRASEKQSIELDATTEIVGGFEAERGAAASVRSADRAGRRRAEPGVCAPARPAGRGGRVRARGRVRNRARGGYLGADAERAANGAAGAVAPGAPAAPRGARAVL